MTDTPFISNYGDLEAFATRTDLLRSEFGHWDVEDPVSHAILDMVEAQRELSDLFYDDAMYGKCSPEAYRAAFAKRIAVAKRLLELTENRDNWPRDYVHVHDR